MCQIYLTHFEQPEKMKHTAEHKVGLSLLSAALKDCYHILIPVDELDSHLEKNEYGKPYLRDYPNIHFNISHGNDIAICAISSQEIGADIEEIREFTPAIFRKVFTEEEKLFFDQMAQNEAAAQEWFFRFWTLKESRIKHAGMGLSMSLTSFSFQFDTSKEPYEISCSDKDVFFNQQILEKQYILSVCTCTPAKNITLKWI